MARHENEIDPPMSMTVEDFHKPLLYRADGTPLRRQIGFAMSQTSGTFPQVKSKGTRIGTKPKKGK